jgi:polyisoprenoid-binding protein YceI
MSATETAQDRLAGTWNFSAVHSSAEFSVKYLVASFRGRFNDIDAKLENGKLTGSVKVDSVSVKDDGLIGHLLSPDFFDGEQHPELTFESDTLTVDGDTAVIDGSLTIKGNTNPIHVTGDVAGPTVGAQGETRLGFTFETTIDRAAYGLDWNAELPAGGKALSNDVKLTVELEFIQG